MIGSDKIAEYIRNPSSIQKESLEDLELLSAKHPYTSIFSLLYLKGLKLCGSIDFDEKLILHSYRIGDRFQLYQLINSEERRAEGQYYSEEAETILPSTVINEPTTIVSVVEESQVEETGIKEEIEKIKAAIEEEIEITPEAVREPVSDIQVDSESDVSEEQAIPTDEPATHHEIADFPSVQSEEVEEEIAPKPALSAITTVILDPSLIKNSEDEDEPEESGIAGLEIKELDGLEYISVRTIKKEDNVQTTEEALVPEEESLEDVTDKLPTDELEETIAHHILSANFQLDELNEEEEKTFASRKALQEESRDLEQKAQEKAIADNTSSFVNWLHADKNYHSGSNFDQVTSSSEVNPIKKNDSLTSLTGEKEKPKTEFFSPTKKAKESLNDDTIPVSETLAKVYVLQGNYPMAIQVYEQLCLKYPEKKYFFADSINEIKKKLNIQ